MLSQSKSYLEGKHFLQYEQSEVGFILDFCRTVYHFVEQYEVPLNPHINIAEYIELAEKSLISIGVHATIISGGRENYIYLHKDDS